MIAASPNSNAIGFTAAKEDIGPSENPVPKSLETAEDLIETAQCLK